MKKYIFIIFCLLTTLACDKVYINGDLDGMWRLVSVETPDSTMTPHQIFYSYQRHLTQVGKHFDEGFPERFLGNLYYEGDVLTMSGFYDFPYESQPATLEKLSEYYLYSDSTVFTILKLDDEMLIMKNEERTYTLRKW